MLEDNLLNLQSMAASRFVAIFADRVRQWEKHLNTISECLDIWFKVQAKWMYLESIFIGSEDIRLQLPMEACGGGPPSQLRWRKRVRHQHAWDACDKAAMWLLLPPHRRRATLTRSTRSSRLS